MNGARSVTHDKSEAHLASNEREVFHTWVIFLLHYGLKVYGGRKDKKPEASIICASHNMGPRAIIAEDWEK